MAALPLCRFMARAAASPTLGVSSGQANSRARPAWPVTLQRPGTGTARSALSALAVFRPAADRTARSAACRAGANDASSYESIMEETNRVLSKIGHRRPGAPLAAGAAPEESSGPVMECDEGGACAPSWAPESDGPAVAESAGDAMSCGPTGCTLVAGAAAVLPGFELLQGPGWRLGYEKRPAAGAEYVALVGGDTWSCALTATEWSEFVDLLRRLQQSVASLGEAGAWGRAAAGDDAALEVKTSRIWLCGTAPRGQLEKLKSFWGAAPWASQGKAGKAGGPTAAFAVRFVLASEGRREVEGAWPAEAVLGMLNALAGQQEAAVPGLSRAAATANARAGGG